MLIISDRSFCPSLSCMRGSSDSSRRTNFTAGQIELYCVFILIFLMFIHVVIIGQENMKGS